MIVTTKIKMDLALGAEEREPVEVMQGDLDTHGVQLILLENGEAWQVPEEAVGTVSYWRGDGTGGIYDTLDDGSAACGFEGNAVTAILAPQMLAQPGPVHMTVALSAWGKRLHTFQVPVNVGLNPGLDLVPEQEYVNIQRWLESLTVRVVQQTGDDAQAVMSQRAVTQALGKLADNSPEFANSIDECTDTSKLYVLPDGYLYAYMTVEEAVEAYTNLVGTSIDTDGSVYNGTGYKQDHRLNSSGSETAQSGTVVCGFIPVSSGDVVRASGSASAKVSGNNHAGFYVNGYDAGFQFLETLAPTDAAGNDGIWDNSGELVLWTVDTALFGTMPAYVRVSMPQCDPDDFVVTVNEEIRDQEQETVTRQQWANTGHLFVAGDYEDRMTAAEENAASLAERVGSLEAAGDGGVPGYVAQEAERVAKVVLGHQNPDTFSLMAVSDLHQHLSHSQIQASNLHAGQGMALVRKSAPVDLAVHLGDGGWGSGVVDDANRATLEMGREELRWANACIAEAFRGVDHVYLQGNHDSLVYNRGFNGGEYLDGRRLWPYSGAHNQGWVFDGDNRHRCYCYRDFETHRLRIIALNTSDISDVAEAGTSIYISGTQLDWLARTLDLSGKADADRWSVLLLGHTPVDWGSCIQASQILKAYLEGGSVSMNRDGVQIDYDYAGKNSAVLIGQLHGHVHGFRVDSIHYLDETGVARPLNVKRVAIPNACYGRSNEYGQNDHTETNGIEFGEETTYPKTAGTGQDTAFCVVTIDLAARLIYADCYGAGYDRVTDFGQ